MLRIVGDRLATVRQEDEYDVVGKNVAAKMRSLDPEQKIYAEKIINDALYEAQLKNLSRYSRLHNPESNEISAKRQPTITNQTPQTYQTYAFPQANQTYAPPQINVAYAPAQTNQTYGFSQTNENYAEPVTCGMINVGPQKSATLTQLTNVNFSDTDE